MTTKQTQLLIDSLIDNCIKYLDDHQKTFSLVYYQFNFWKKYIKLDLFCQLNNFNIQQVTDYIDTFSIPKYVNTLIFSYNILEPDKLNLIKDKNPNFNVYLHDNPIYYNFDYFVVPKRILDRYTMQELRSLYSEYNTKNTITFAIYKTSQDYLTTLLQQNKITQQQFNFYTSYIDHIYKIITYPYFEPYIKLDMESLKQDFDNVIIQDIDNLIQTPLLNEKPSIIISYEQEQYNFSKNDQYLIYTPIYLVNAYVPYNPIKKILVK